MTEIEQFIAELEALIKKYKEKPPIPDPGPQLRFLGWRGWVWL